MVGKQQPVRPFHPARQAFNVNGVRKQSEHVFLFSIKFKTRIDIARVRLLINIIFKFNPGAEKFFHLGSVHSCEIPLSKLIQCIRVVGFMIN